MNNGTWAWGKEKKLILNQILETAQKADSEATRHIRELASNLLQSKLKSTKLQLQGGLVGTVTQGIMIVPSLLNPESKTGQILAKTVYKRGQETALKENQVKNKLREIKSLIPTMKTRQLYKLIKDLIEGIPIIDIAI
jgi:hypothetical protein